MRKRFLTLAVTASLFVFSGCTSQTVNETSSKTNEDVKINEKITDEIKERGYLRTGCKTDVPELSFYDEKSGEWTGLETELAYKTAAEIFGVTPEDAKEQNLVHFTGVTVADRETVLESGEIDCMLATYTITDERKERFAISDSYYTSYIGLMVKDRGEDINSLGSQSIHSIAELDGKYIGVPRNATTRKDFIDYINMMNTLKVNPIFCEYEGYDILYDALKNGNIDVIAVDVSILSGYDDNTTKILDDRFAPQKYGAAVLKENAPLIDVINKVIE